MDLALLTLFNDLLLFGQIYLFVVGIVYTAKKKKHKGFGLFNVAFGSVAIGAIVASTLLSLGSMEMVGMIIFVVWLLLSIGSIVFGCIITPRTQNLAQETANSSAMDSKATQEAKDEEDGQSTEDWTLAYKHSARRKLTIFMVISWCSAGALMILALALSLAGLGGVIAVPFVLGFILGIVALFITGSRRGYCPRCGCEGVVDGKEMTDKNTKIEKKRISEFQAIPPSGHVEYSKDGTAYEEQLVSISTYSTHLHCPKCGNEWEVKTKEKSRT